MLGIYTTEGGGGGGGASVPASAGYGWEADLGVTPDGGGVVTDGAPVLSWEDQIAAQLASQASAARQPIWIEDYAEGLPALKFDGIDDIMESVGQPSYAHPYTLIWVGEVVLKPTGTQYVMHTPAAANDSNLGKNVSGNIQVGGGISVQTLTPWPTGRCMVFMAFDGADSQLWLDGVQIGAMNTGNEPMLGIRFGAVTTVSQHIECAMHGVYYDPGVFTAAKRDEWVEFCAARWSLVPARIDD